MSESTTNVTPVQPQSAGEDLSEGQELQKQGVSKEDAHIEDHPDTPEDENNPGHLPSSGSTTTDGGTG